MWSKAVTPPSTGFRENIHKTFRFYFEHVANLPPLTSLLQALPTPQTNKPQISSIPRHAHHRHTHTTQRVPPLPCILSSRDDRSRSSQAAMRNRLPRSAVDARCCAGEVLGGGAAYCRGRAACENATTYR
jgi:hypothetical protein